MKFDLVFKKIIPEELMTEIIINDVFLRMYDQLRAEIPEFEDAYRKQLARSGQINMKLKNDFFPHDIDLSKAYYYVSYVEGTIKIFEEDGVLPQEISVDLTLVNDEAFVHIRKDQYEMERSFDNVVFAAKNKLPDDVFRKCMEEYEQNAGDYFMDLMVLQEELLPPDFPHCFYDWSLEYGTKKLILSKKEMRKIEAI